MMKKYNTMEEYSAAQKSTTESTVSLITDGNIVEYDGVNVITREPKTADVVFIDGDGKVVFIAGETVNKATIPAGWKHAGYVFKRFADAVLIIHPDVISQKWADVVQFRMAGLQLDGQQHEASFGLRLSGGTAAGYDANTVISFSYSATELSQVVPAINAAIERAKAEIGFTNIVWAYIPEPEQGLGEDIIVQIDTWDAYQQYQSGGNVGCTMTHVTWEDMPSSSSYLKVTGATNGGYMSLKRFIIYYGASGSVPTANQVVGNAERVNRASFEQSEFCADLREYYGTYEAFCEAEFKIARQQYGAFGLPSGREMAERYAGKWAPTKAGERKFKFPALNWAASVSVDADGLRTWWLPGVDEGCALMDDDTTAVLAGPVSKMGTTAINNATSRWLAERCYASYAWIFYGTYGTLTNGNVTTSLRCQAVTLFKLNK